MKKKALVFVDHDLVIRHFVQSGVFRELEDRYDVKYVMHTDSTSDKTGINSDVSSLNLSNCINMEVSRARMGGWWHLYVVTAMRLQRGTENFSSFRRITAATMTNGGGWRSWRYVFLGLPGIFGWYQKRYLKKMGILESLQDLLVEERPDIILHPSLLAGYFINEIGPIAKELKIPFVAMMNSFDNPSQKAVCTTAPDKLIVWGPQTKEHAVELMGMPPEDVLVFGAAQFQLYRNAVTEPVSELCEMFGVPEGVPTILYAGVSKGVNETRHLKMLDDAIALGDIPMCHILFRPHPWRGELVEGEKDFFAERFKHVSMDPHMVDFYQSIVDNPTSALYMADYDITRKLLALITATISPLSTILLETMLHHKPVLGFFPQEDLDNNVFVNIGLELAHFRGFFDNPGVHITSDPAALPDMLSKMLDDADNPEVVAALKEKSKYYCVMDGPTYGERLLEMADQLTV